MREYDKLSSIGAALGFPPDGKRFGRALVEVGLRNSKGHPTPDAIARGMAKRHGHGATGFTTSRRSPRS